MSTSFQELFTLKPNIYITDFLDIAIIAVIIYSIFLLLRKTKSYLVFLGLAITAGLYFVSRAFNLYLTFFALQYFVGVSVVIFVIIFQNEIRKYLELVGLISSRRIKVGKITPKSPMTTDIVQACVQMAQAKIGALIVIQGRDDIDLFLDGGVTLDGVITEDILLSIFDPHSIGHDGALIISNNRISKFGTHLPLSTNFKELGKHGTRHGAALGLSEQTDALSIVVSEEKKEISICRDGKMKTLKKFDDLERELARYINSKFQVEEQKVLTKFFKHNYKFKLTALATAMLIWFFTAYQAGFIEKTYKVPITIIDTPENTLIEDYSPKEITVTVSGRGEAIFSGISRDNFKITFDASNIQDDVNKISILEKNIVIPTNLTLVKYEPEVFLLTAQKYYKVSISIRPQIVGTPQEGLEIKSVEVTPEKVDAWVLQNTEAPSELTTEPIDVTNEKEPVILQTNLVVPEEIKLDNGDATVNVALTIEERGGE